MRTQTGILAVGLLLLLARCKGDDNSEGEAASVGGAGTGGATQAGGGGASASAAAGGSDTGGSAAIATEGEPNNGSTADEYNVLPVATSLTGALSTAADVDFFWFDATPGNLYHAQLASEGPLKLTLMDAGRNAEAPGNDYVKIMSTNAGPVLVDVLALGEGGYFVAVSADNNTSEGETPYTLSVTELDKGAFSGPPLTPQSPEEYELPYPGAVHLYPWEIESGASFELRVTGNGSFDGRLFIVDEASSDWLARADDSETGLDPTIEEEAFWSGGTYVVVENIEPNPSLLSYTIEADY